MEIGTWSNDMAANIKSNTHNGDGDDDDDSWDGILPPNINMCSRDNSESEAIPSSYPQLSY